MVSIEVSIPHIPGYHVSEEIYNGSRTLVYRGFREADNKPVVLKLLKNSYPSFNELVQFRNQYTIAKNLQSPLIIGTYSLEAYQNGYVLVMEDFGGIALSQWHKIRTNVLSLMEFFQIAIALCNTLDILYRHRIIHKDIKPANILINPETKQIKLIDFSIASLLPRETQTLISLNVLEGTLAYLSPEQTGRMNRGIDYRTDFYSLGVTFYELLTGELPFQSNDPMELVHCHIAKIPTALGNREEIPQVLADMVMKLLAKNAEDRYQSALGLKYDLENCLEQLQTTGKIESFPIGRRDVCDRFLIPDKLYGRTAEVEKLLTAFKQVSTGAKEMVLVAGFSGIGKTAVVNEVHKPIVQKRGYFIKGKFDQFNRNIPFSAFVQALRNLMLQLLSESDAQLQKWKSQILQALGENAQVIVEVIPELEQIIGVQPPVPELAGNAAQNRFNLLFQKFIAIFTTKEHPLVIFLDDLQWADLASLKLMELLMSETGIGYLLLMGAYRDNEVSPVHPLIVTLNEIQVDGANINTLTLPPLKLSQINQLIADTLSCSLELALPLTKLVYQKTQGNPFFNNQFLKVLYEEGLITFNVEQGYWECDIAQVNALALTDDVVEFMSMQLQKLPAATQDVLKLAACIGNTFDLATLATVRQKSLVASAAELWSALQSGLILPQSEVYKFFQAAENNTDTKLFKYQNSQTPTYKFLHDRVQQAAYFLIPEAQKKFTHLNIGRLILSNTPKSQIEDKIFQIVNQLNQGVELLTKQDDKHELAQLNFQAGYKAKNATAYSAAWEYLTIGRHLLADDDWQSQYNLSLSLYAASVEVAYLSGNFAEMEKLAEILLKEAKNLVDQVKVYDVKNQALVAQNKPVEAVNNGLKFLKLLGVEFPTEPSQADIIAGLQATQSLWQDKGIAELINLPVMTDPIQLAAMQMLSSISAASYLAVPALYPLIYFKQVSLSITYGNTAISTHSYACYALILSAIVGDFETGYQFGKLALDLLPQLKAKELECKVQSMVYGFVKHWKIPVKETLIPLRSAYYVGLETGDLQFAGYSAVMYCGFTYFAGIEKELSDLQREVFALSDSINQIKQVTCLQYFQMLQQAIHDLRSGRNVVEYLQGEYYDEPKMLNQHLQAHDRLGIFYLYFNKLLLNYLLGNYQQAVVDAALTEQHLDGAAGFAYIPIFYFYDSLTQLAAYRENLVADKEKLVAKITTNQEKMKNWAHNAPMNCQYKFDLVEAEYQRLFGEKWQAMEMYDRAIAGAKDNGYLRDEALANELAASFYLDCGKEKVAQAYLQEAYYGYARWGAKAKVEDLERRYPQLLKSMLQRQQYSLNATTTIANTISETSASKPLSDRTVSEILDLATILKASHALSSEIHLEQLLSTLLSVVMENAGADKGVLLLQKENRLVLEAIATLGVSPTLVRSLPLEESLDIPISLINSVKRTLQAATIDNANTDPMLMVDTYIISQQPKSLLCTPIIHQGKLLGILYLENHLTVGAFTSDRLTVLNLLCTQGAISLENARLYQESQANAQKLAQSLKKQKTLFDVVTQMRESLDLDAIFCAVTQNMRRILNADRVGIYQFEAESKYEYGKFIAEDVIPEFPSALAINVKDHCFGEDYANLYKQGRICAMADLNSTKVLDCHRAILEQFHVKASLVVAIIQHGELWGLLCVHQCDRPREWRGSEIQFAQQIAAQLGVALQQADLLLQTRQQATQLEQALQHLQQTQLQLVQNEKMSALGNLVAGVAHEINNPVGFIAGNLEPAKDYVQDLFDLIELYETLPHDNAAIEDKIASIDLEYLREDLPKLLDSMSLGIERIGNISTSLRTFSRADKAYKVPFNIHEGIDSTILILKHRLKANEHHPAIEIVKEYGQLPMVECFAGQLNQVFMNLLANAIDALEESNSDRSFAEIQANPNQITIRTTKSEDGKQAVISIQDNGTGMSEEVKHKIFDHLFTTKGVGKGTGLGLAIARQIVEETHNGRLICNSVLGEGTEFLIQIPM
ncbi:two-component hybrid sensor and regulator [Nostoc carneum NIES-2107]|nr:two-component hybrid sensor and regulator [Nostoc carneum NIES-2107]